MPTTTVFRSEYHNEQEELRLKLLERGYTPVPVRGKSPDPIFGWNTGDFTPDRINRDIKVWPEHTNTGLLTTITPVIDIDLWDDDHVAEIGIVVADHIGLSPLVRRGRKGLALYYRLVGEPISKLVVKADMGEKNEKGYPKYKTLVEILGKGNQSVSYGIHPDTQKPYSWVGDCEPLLMPHSELPAVTPEDLRTLIGAMRVRLGELGYKVERTFEGESRAIVVGKRDDALDVTDMFLRLIPSVRRSPSGYYNFPCPSCGHNDRKSGIVVTSGGGFRFKCFHASCEFHGAAGWEPTWRIGRRVKHLYELLGGDREDLEIVSILEGYESMTEFFTELYQ